MSIALLVAIAMASTASSAFAREPRPYTGTSFGPDGVGGSAKFLNLQSLAVEQSSGNVFAYDARAGKVYKFDSSGAPVNFSSTGTNSFGGLEERFGSGEFEIAIAPAGSPGGTAGDIYVADNTNSLKVYSSGGGSLGAIAIGEETCGVAVNPTGHLFVGSYPDKVREFTPSANPPLASDQTAISSASLSNVCNVAADGLGNVYAASYNGEQGAGVVKLEGIADTTATSVDPAATTMAVDPSNNDLYTDRGNLFAQYSSSGGLIGTSGIGQLSESRGIAFNASADKVYVSRGREQGVGVFGPRVLLPDATTGGANDLHNESATVAGTVNPLGTEASYQFEYGTSIDYGSTSPASPVVVGNDSTNHTVTTDLTGLQPNTVYHYRVLGVNGEGTEAGEDRTFRTTGQPIVETTGSTIRTTTTALLEGRVDPETASTSYYFEYGPGPCDASTCLKTDPVAAGNADEITLVAARVLGLEPGTVYHYRLVADNGNEAGLAIGGDMTVETRTSDAPLTHGTLPGPVGSDRAWEQVNAPDLGGHNVSEVRAVSNDGDRIVYNVKGGTPDSNLGSLYTPLLAERTASGWKSKSITPTQVQPGAFKAWNDIEADSTLSTIVGGTHGPGTALWRMGGNVTPTPLLIYPSPIAEYIEYFATSEDGSTIVVTAQGSLDPDHQVANEAQNLYDVSSGSAHLIDLLPDGSVPSCGVPTEGSAVSGSLQNGFTLRNQGAASAHWISSDDRLAYFPSQGDDCFGPSLLYMRNLQEGTTTRISAPAVSGPDCSAAFIKSTPTSVYFWTAARLSPDDVKPESEFCGARGYGDIYRYGLEDETTTCVTCVVPGAEAAVAFDPGSPNGAANEMAVASDGSRVYFRSEGSLVHGAPSGGAYRVDTHTNDLRYIAPATVGELSGFLNAISADGSVLAFASSSAALNPIGGTNNGGTIQYYLYDDDTRALTCASCPQDGAAATMDTTVSTIPDGLIAAEHPLGPNLSPLDAAGDVFAFATPTSLTKADQNEAAPGENSVVGADVYEWRDGRQILVSDGITASPPAFGTSGVAPRVGGVSPSGRDIYFLDAVQLTPDALEKFPRLYDARIGGGFEFPNPPPPCPLEVCQGTPAGAPAQPSPGSRSFSGPGDAKSQGNRHGKRHRRKHKSPHKKRHKRSSDSRPTNKRRASR